MSRFRKVDIETHSDRSRSRPAVNVKYYAGGDLTDNVVEYFKCSRELAEQALAYAFESAQQRFWEDAQEYARELFGKHVKVYSEGRSGGWLVVHGIDENVEGWDAIAVSKWGRLVKWCTDTIVDYAAWENVQDDIEANEWAKDGAELYNFLTLKDGRHVTMSELKNAHKPPKEDA